MIAKVAKIAELTKLLKKTKKHHDNARFRKTQNKLS